jgi:hypothetical protein
VLRIALEPDGLAPGQCHHAPPIGHGLDQQQPAPAFGELFVCFEGCAGGAEIPVGDFDADPVGSAEEEDGAATAGHMAYEVGDELGHRQLGGVDQGPALTVTPSAFTAFVAAATEGSV